VVGRSNPFSAASGAQVEDVIRWSTMRKELAAGPRGSGAVAVRGAVVAAAASKRLWEDRALIEENLRKLSVDEEQVLRLLFGIGEVAHSRDELGRRLGISPKWLRQIERKALRHLRRVALSEDSADRQALRARRRSARALM
jgi:hypothetical protein